jgi:hypothetical protein
MSKKGNLHFSNEKIVAKSHILNAPSGTAFKGPCPGLLHTPQNINLPLFNQKVKKNKIIKDNDICPSDGLGSHMTNFIKWSKKCKLQPCT